MRALSTVFGLALTAASSLSAAQAVGDPSTSMGGAGLALPQHNGLNPAQLSVAHGAFRLHIPVLEYRASGRDMGQITSYLNRMRRSGMDPRTLSRTRVDSFGGSIGLRYGETSLNYFARGYEEVLLTPGASDGYGLAIEGYQLSHGREFRTHTGKLSVGATAKMVTAYYDHQRMSDGAGATRIGSKAPGKSGLGLDLGVIYQPDLRRELYYGASIANLVSPGITFDRRLPDGSFQSHGVEPFRTTVSAGIAGSAGDRTWFAIDGIDLTNSLGRRQVALGVEHALSRYLTLQLGYNSRTAFTVGLSLFGISARIAGRTPLTVESGFRF